MISIDFLAINLHLLIISCSFPATFKITLVPGTAALPLVKVRPKQSPSSRSTFPSWLSDFWDVSWYHDSNHQRLISQGSSLPFLVYWWQISWNVRPVEAIAARSPTNQDHLCPVNRVNGANIAVPPSIGIDPYPGAIGGWDKALKEDCFNRLSGCWISTTLILIKILPGKYEQTGPLNHTHPNASNLANFFEILFITFSDPRDPPS